MVAKSSGRNELSLRSMPAYRGRFWFRNVGKCGFKVVLARVAFALQVALAAHLFVTPVIAAVPVEESVGETGTRVTSPASETRQPLRADRPATQSLDIPPTIEPQVHTESVQPEPESPAPGLVTQPGTGQLGDLFYQLQVLQQELQELRGLVEEQGYLVSRLQRDQKEQYLDLDRRLMAVTENRPSPGPTTSLPEQPAALPGGGTPLTEREAYTAAFDAMRSREFDSSMQGFMSLIQQYPNGQFTPNAYYWVGELHLVANSDPEQARQAFMQVVSLYPDHQKAPDAMYKLGVVYHNLGDNERAHSFLGQVQREYPDSSAAGLAARYAADLQ